MLVSGLRDEAPWPSGAAWKGLKGARVVPARALRMPPVTSKQSGAG